MNFDSIINIHIHVILLLIFLTLFFYLYVSKLTVNLFQNNINNTIDQEITKLSYDEKHLLKNLINQIPNNAINSFNSPSLSLTINNNWIQYSIITLILFLCIVLIIVIYILYIYNKNIINVFYGIVIDNCILFIFILCIEYIFFKYVASNYQITNNNTLIYNIFSRIRSNLNIK